MGLLLEKCLLPGILIGFWLEWDQRTENGAAQQEKDRDTSCQDASLLLFFRGVMFVVFGEQIYKTIVP